MRNILSTSALAAVLTVSMLSFGYAASDGSRGDAHGESGHTWNNKYDHLITDPMNMTDATGAFFWFKPVAMEAKVGEPSPLLTQLDDELAKSADRAETARRKRELTAAEAKQIRDEHDAIRQTALTQIRQHDGQLPEDGYEALQGRIVALNELIERFSRA